MTLAHRTLATLAIALLPGTAAAQIASVFNDVGGGTSVTCTVQTGDNAGERHCEGIVYLPSLKTPDVTIPIDVNVAFPPAPASGPDGNYPVLGYFHGWNGSKFSNTNAVAQRFLDAGYAYLSMSDRGWGMSCGGMDSKRLGNACAEGYNHLMDTRYEVRDAQRLLGYLVDEGLIHPTQIGVMGSSYGGGLSMALATLKNRVMPIDFELDAEKGGTQELAPWTSPGGTPMAIAAAAPDVPWTDLAYSLQPNGSTLDYVAHSPYLGPNEDQRVGVMKQSYVSGLYGTGQAGSNYAPAGTDEDADLNTWYSLINAGEPYDENPQAAGLIEELTTHHSSYYLIDIDTSVEPAPLHISNGFTDDLFPPEEAVRYYNKLRARHPDADVHLFFGDHGHDRGVSIDTAGDGAALTASRYAWIDHFVLGTGQAPQHQVTVFAGQACDGPIIGPFTAPTWGELAQSEWTLLDDSGAVNISPEAGNPQAGQTYDPIAGGGACASISDSTPPGIAAYTFPSPAAGGYTLAGSPTVVIDVLNISPNSQLAARLVDVDPNGDARLVSRGLFRPPSGTDARRVVFQMQPNVHHVADDHVLKLELLPNDKPYGRASNGQGVVTVSRVDIRLPILQAPDGADLKATYPRVVPPGYVLAPEYSGPIDTDGDRIIDGDDACVTQSGRENEAAHLHGCPDNPVDSDGDGVPDESDACPDEAGTVENGGCPENDADGDGVLDNNDDCPNDAGPASNNGCPLPDTDSDGVPDAEDTCPNEAGPLSNNGCPLPDADGDGVPDAEDDCPAEAGPETNAGCPLPVDTDGDGVVDEDDQCPAEAGPASNNGCPTVTPLDSDGDGVPDAEDDCPNEGGAESNNGCPIPPDSDGDGTPDADDDCPATAGPISNAGCPLPPDTDGDGLRDHEDDCPDDFGPPTNAGCPEVDEDPAPARRGGGGALPAALLLLLAAGGVVRTRQRR